MLAARLSEMNEALTGFLPSPTAWLICAVAMIGGTVIQKLSGAGFGMIATPTMTLVSPGLMPGTILLLELVVGLGAFFGG